ncbi:MAG: hypothetical protein EA409_02005 [Saprospirales bacterium]|nr:MAG: hypothetical protein EA409_02005 [Saprospirales bacterium]
MSSDGFLFQARDEFKSPWGFMFPKYLIESKLAMQLLLSFTIWQDGVPVGLVVWEDKIIA